MIPKNTGNFLNSEFFIYRLMLFTVYMLFSLQLSAKSAQPTARSPSPHSLSA
jgi:hypothetical protein